MCVHHLTAMGADHATAPRRKARCFDSTRRRTSSRVASIKVEVSRAAKDAGFAAVSEHACHHTTAARDRGWHPVSQDCSVSGPDSRLVERVVARFWPEHLRCDVDVQDWTDRHQGR